MLWKKKVVIIIPSLRGGGAERVIVNIVRHLDYQKLDLRLIVIKKRGPYIKLLPKSLQVIDLDSDRVRYSLVKLIKAINEFQPDVILSTLEHLNLALLGIRKLLKGNPKIIVREANTPSQNMTKLSRSKRLLFTVLYKKLYPTADLIIAQCQNMKKDIIKTFNIEENKIIYIYNPVDIEKIIEDSVKYNPYDKNKKNIVTIGRLTFQKGFDILINAFKVVNDRIPDTYLTVLGEGPLEKDLIALVNHLNITKQVSFVGFQENPYPYIHYADVYVLSSRWEGFPNTLLEALTCGIKIVATDCESGPREILGDNEYGFLVPMEDYELLAQAIIKSLNNENKTKDRAKNFDINNVIKEYEKILM